MTTPTILEPAIKRLEEELGAIELDVLTSYTLADAIREGCGVTAQLTGGWADKSGNACALSAAYVAAKARGYIA